MKTMMLAAVAALSLTAGAAFAGEGEMLPPNQPARTAPAPVVRDGGVLHSFAVTHTRQDQNSYLFGGDGSGS